MHLVNETMAHKQNSQAMKYKSVPIENQTKNKTFSHNRANDANLHTKAVNL